MSEWGVSAPKCDVTSESGGQDLADSHSPLVQIERRISALDTVSPTRPSPPSLPPNSNTASSVGQVWPPVSEIVYAAPPPSRAQV